MFQYTNVPVYNCTIAAGLAGRCDDVCDHQVGNPLIPTSGLREAENVLGAGKSVPQVAPARGSGRLLHRRPCLGERTEVGEDGDIQVIRAKLPEEVFVEFNDTHVYVV